MMERTLHRGLYTSSEHFRPEQERISYSCC
jgi:hypothetical protein